MNISNSLTWWTSLAGGLLMVASVTFFTWDWILARFFLSHMDSTKRIERLQVDRVIETLNIQPGQWVADIGAGTGLFSFRMAERVGNNGRVYAVDINPTLVTHLTENAKERDIPQLIAVLGQDDDPRLPESVDLILFCDTLHHIEDRKNYLQRLQPFLNPNGRIAVIDFKQKWSLFHRMKYGLEELDEWMEAAGCERAENHTFLAADFFAIHQVK